MSDQALTIEPVIEAVVEGFTQDELTYPKSCFLGHITSYVGSECIRTADNPIKAIEAMQKILAGEKQRFVEHLEDIAEEAAGETLQ